MRALGLLTLLSALLGCSSPVPRPDTEPSPFVYQKEQLYSADKIVFLLPGALTPGQIFDPVQAWAAQGYAPVYYRFPGMDGAGTGYDLVVEQAMRDVVDFANRYPDKKIRLIGFSTGAPIAILASAEIRHADTKVAAMSAAVERGGGAMTFLNGTFDLLAAAVRAGSFKLDQLWPEYYKTLLFGRDGLRAPDRQAQAEKLLAQERDRLILPDKTLNRAHARDLRNWRIPDGLIVSPEKIRFFVGLSDPVFTTDQTKQLSSRLGGPTIIGYPKHGHILFVSRPEVYDDILAFFEESGT